MTLRISGKSINVGDALRGRVSERTDEVLRKYFDGNYSGHITLSKDGSDFRTDTHCIWIPASRWKRIPALPTLMPARTRRC
jgi:ribosome-associated translation inhibitor RaiA